MLIQCTIFALFLTSWQAICAILNLIYWNIFWWRHHDYSLLFGVFYSYSTYTTTLSGAMAINNSWDLTQINCSASTMVKPRYFYGLPRKDRIYVTEVRGGNCLYSNNHLLILNVLVNEFFENLVLVHLYLYMLMKVFNC